MPFVFTYDGKAYRESDLKPREVQTVEDVTGVRYWGHVPVKPDGEVCDMGHAIAYAAVFLRRDHSDDEVERIIDETPLPAWKAMWSVEDDDMPDMFEGGVPLAAGGPSTTTS